MSPHRMLVVIGHLGPLCVVGKAALGYGRRGSRAFEVPPDSFLEYTVTMRAINLQEDPNVRRRDLDDERRFAYDAEGTQVTYDD